MPSNHDEKRGNANRILKWDGFRQAGYRGEIRHDTAVVPPVYHYLVVNEATNEIVVWSQERSMEDARRALEATLLEMAPQRRAG